MPFFGIYHFRKSALILKEKTCEPNLSVVSFLPGLALMKTTVLEPMRTLLDFRLDTLAFTLCSYNSDMSSKWSLTYTRLSRSNVNSVVHSYLLPILVGVGVGTNLIWAVHQTLLPARVWLRETTREHLGVQLLCSSNYQRKNSFFFICQEYVHKISAHTNV